jgi:hypothetical protein
LVLVTLAELGYLAGDEALIPLREQTLTATLVTCPAFGASAKATPESYRAS